LSAQICQQLLQFCVFRLALLQDGNVGVGVGVFPQGEEILIRRASLRGVALEDVRAAQAQGREWHIERVETTVIQNFLELLGGSPSFAQLQVGLPTHVSRRESSILT